MKKTVSIAFTLIELLVVIAIIGILSGLIVVTMNGVTQKANIAKAQVFSNSLRNALMLNLISEWKLDQINSNQTPDSWGTATGTLNGSGGSQNLPQLQATGCVYGQCINFDGSDDYINFGNGNLDITGNITVEVWVKSSRLWSPSNQTYVNILAKDDSSNGYALRVYERSGDLKTYIEFRLMSGGTASGGLMYNVPNNFSYQSWTNIVGTRDGTGIKLYVNGMLVATATDQAPGSNTNGLYLGFSAGGVSTYGYWPGVIDNVRIYDKAVPVSLIKEQYYAGLNSIYLKGGMTEEEYVRRIGTMAVAD